MKHKSFVHLFKGGGGGGAEPFLAHRNGRTLSDIPKTQEGGRTILQIIRPWGNPSEDSPSSTQSA